MILSHSSWMLCNFLLSFSLSVSVQIILGNDIFLIFYSLTYSSILSTYLLNCSKAFSTSFKHSKALMGQVQTWYEILGKECPISHAPQSWSRVIFTSTFQPAQLLYLFSSCLQFLSQLPSQNSPQTWEVLQIIWFSIIVSMGAIL